MRIAGADGAAGGSGRRRDRSVAARVELADAFGRLTQLLALLLGEVLQLANLDREPFEELVDLVDVVALQADLKGHRVDGVEGRVCVIRAVHAATLPLDLTQSTELSLK